MTKSSFEAYGELAQSDVSSTELSGRYEMQAEAERRIISDVSQKLQIHPSASLLDIGCGAGSLLIPLSFAVARAVGIDHPNVISRTRQYSHGARIEWIAGQFPDVVLGEHFDRILLYSVIHCIASFAELLRLVDVAANLLTPGGRLLIGDIPNRDRKRRFLESHEGRIFEQEWQERRPSDSKGKFSVFDGATAIGSLNDEAVIEIMQRGRVNGFHTYILPQPPDLPFGHTREDLLIVRP